jgi:hypothetical protein
MKEKGQFTCEERPVVVVLEGWNNVKHPIANPLLPQAWEMSVLYITYELRESMM